MMKTGIEPEGVKLQAGDTLTVLENKKRYFLIAPVAKFGENIYPEDEQLTLFTTR